MSCTSSNVLHNLLYTPTSSAFSCRFCTCTTLWQAEQSNLHQQGRSVGRLTVQISCDGLQQNNSCDYSHAGGSLIKTTYYAVCNTSFVGAVNCSGTQTEVLRQSCAEWQLCMQADWYKHSLTGAALKLQSTLTSGDECF